jgi:copper chaperone CopZ
MKISVLAVSAAVALAVSSLAYADDANAKINGVHLCCGKCVTGAEKAVESVPGAKATVNKDEGTVTITAPDKATAQKAADALVKAGYFGRSSDVKMDASTGAKGEKVQKLKVQGVHLCCPKCVKAVNSALKGVDGVKENNATKGAESFDVSGDFNDKAVFTALQKEGLTGKAAE